MSKTNEITIVYAPLERLIEHAPAGVKPRAVLRALAAAKIDPVASSTGAMVWPLEQSMDVISTLRRRGRPSRPELEHAEVISFECPQELLAEVEAFRGSKNFPVRQSRAAVLRYLLAYALATMRGAVYH